jgi:hypothetical protein
MGGRAVVRCLNQVSRYLMIMGILLYQVCRELKCGSNVLDGLAYGAMTVLPRRADMLR